MGGLHTDNVCCFPFGTGCEPKDTFPASRSGVFKYRRYHNEKSDCSPSIHLSVARVESERVRDGVAGPIGIKHI